MTDSVKLPPMPEFLANPNEAYYSEEQLRAYAIQAALEERERCAKLCEAERYTGYVPPEDGDARSYYDIAGENCADAIRAQPEPQP